MGVRMSNVEQLPVPRCTFADHSYPAYTAQQMADFAKAARDGALSAQAERIEALAAKCALLETSLAQSDDRIAELERDAGRYRWLREGAKFSKEFSKPTMLTFSALEGVEHDFHIGFIGSHFDTDVDRAIDAAISAGSQGRGG